MKSLKSTASTIVNGWISPDGQVFDTVGAIEHDELASRLIKRFYNKHVAYNADRKQASDFLLSKGWIRTGGSNKFIWFECGRWDNNTLGNILELLQQNDISDNTETIIFANDVRGGGTPVFEGTVGQFKDQGVVADLSSVQYSIVKVASLKFSKEEEPSFYDMVVDNMGNVYYYNEKGQSHRLDGPAIEHWNGGKEWFIEGVPHREDGPAFEDGKGNKIWYVNGQRHRLDGPAVEWSNGDKEWWVNGKLHREDGPAIEYSGGIKAWYINGKLHRIDGPAIIRPDNARPWHIEGEHAMDSLVPPQDGYNSWYINGKLHRIDGPAIERSDGTKEWWVGDKRHRLDGPAVERASGSKEWYVNGEWHRLDGPAIEWADGRKEWRVNGQRVGRSEEGFTDEDFERWKKEHGL